MGDALDRILEAKRRALHRAKAALSLNELEVRIRQAPKARDFLHAVTSYERVAVIAEMKRKSPSAGGLRPDFDPAAIARAYQSGGAAALSVLTEADHFAGSLDDLAAARAAVDLPLLRKDFIFDPYQMAEARAFGADGVLLIADMLPAGLLRDLAATAFFYGLEPLVEVFTPAVITAALESGARLIGINTRNLRTLELHPNNVFELAQLVPGDRFVVAESGIKTPGDVAAYKAAKVAAVLVGESLLKQSDLEAGVRALVEAGQR